MTRRAAHTPWAAAFRQVRLDRGWPLKRMAREVGVALQTIHNWEYGKAEPGISMFVAWARVCGYGVEVTARDVEK